MKYQKVNMVVRFVVPVGTEYYAERADAPWKRYAEHDMRLRLKDIEDIPEVYQHTVYCSDNYFEWLEEFDSEEPFFRAYPFG